jgi:tetratricopeptide (TPR) repeat protein
VERGGGPLVNVALLPVTLGLYLAARSADWGSLFPDAYHFLFTLTLLNAALLAFNLLPLYPLDGGQMLHAVLWFFVGRGRSLMVVSFLGLLGAVTLCGVLLAYHFWWAALATLFLVGQAALGLVQADFLGRPGWEHLGPSLAYLHQGETDKAIAESSLAIEHLREPGPLAMAHQRRGVAHAARGDYPRALADLSRAVEIGPGAVLHFTRGQVHLLAGNRDSAIADFSATLSHDGGHARAYHQRGEAYFQLGDRARAAEDLACALAIDPTLPEIYAPAGDPAAQARRLAWAIAACDTFLQVQTVPGAEACNRAAASIQAGDAQAGLRECDEAIRLNPRLSPAYVNRAEAHRRLGRLDEALADVETALTLGPPQAAAHVIRAAVWHARGELGRAIASCTEALNLDPRFAPAYEERGLAHEAAGDPERAAADYTEALRLDPGAVRLYYFRALAHKAGGRDPLAIADYLEVIRLDADQPDAWNNLAHLWATCAEDGVRDGRKALEYATRACELTHWQEANFLDTLAAAHAEAGEFAQAVRWQKAALEDPEFSESYGERARRRLQLYEQATPARG